MSKTLKKVPIFALGVDKRTESFTEDWFDKVALPTFNADKAGGYKPVAHIGHTDPKGDKTERPRVAFLDNLARVGKQVFADLTEIPDIAASAIEQNLFPNRSVEIRADGKGFHSLALLGATEPHFKLDQQSFVMGQFKAIPDDGERTVIHFEAADMTLEENIEVNEKKRQLSELDWALYDALCEIRESESLSGDEKKSAMNTKIDEWAGLAKTKQAEIVDITDGAQAAAAEDAQFKADQQDALIKQFAAREAALAARENKLLEQEFANSKLAPQIIKNFLALRPHLDDAKPSIRFKAGNTESEVSPRAAFEEFLRDLNRRFEAGTLFAVTEPLNAGNLVSADPTADDQENKQHRETKLIEQFMAEQKITNFAAARAQWLATEQGRQFRA